MTAVLVALTGALALTGAGLLVPVRRRAAAADSTRMTAAKSTKRLPTTCCQNAQRNSTSRPLGSQD
jgi:hypothetical protein